MRTWCRSPPGRFVADSALEGNGFELPVPHAMHGRPKAIITGFGRKPPRLVFCDCRRRTSPKAGQSEVSEPKPSYRARNRKFEFIPLHQRFRRSRWIERLCRAPVSSASRDSAYPARGSTHSRRVQGAHLALAATRGNHATRGGASAARNCARGIALPGWPRVGAANRSSPLIGRCPARIVAQSISASGGHDGGFLYE